MSKKEATCPVCKCNQLKLVDNKPLTVVLNPKKIPLMVLSVCANCGNVYDVTVEKGALLKLLKKETKKKKEGLSYVS